MRPETEEQMAEAVADAAADGRGLEIRGGGTRGGLGHGVAGAVLETGGLSGITLYEPGALTLVARAGTPMREIREALLGEGQQLPFEPMDHRALFGTKGEPTIGGVAACNVSGPRRVQAGACRDSMIGVRFLDGRGTLVKNGGRVMKNVTGYDLVKLMAGSYGTLGVLTEVSFKVLPAAQAQAVVSVAGLSDADAVRAMAAVVGSPYDVTGAAHVPGPEARTLVRVEGLPGSVAYRAEQLSTLLGAFGPITVERDLEAIAEIWAKVRDVPDLAAGEGDIWRVSVKPSDGPAVRAAVGKDTPAIYDWAGGQVWMRVAAGRDVRAAIAGIAGHATLIRADAATKSALGVFQPEAAPLARISAGLRAQFDPEGILNPGRMG